MIIFCVTVVSFFGTMCGFIYTSGGGTRDVDALKPAAITANETDEFYSGALSTSSYFATKYAIFPTTFTTEKFYAYKAEPKTETQQGTPFVAPAQPIPAPAASTAPPRPFSQTTPTNPAQAPRAFAPYALPKPNRTIIDAPAINIAHSEEPLKPEPLPSLNDYYFNEKEAMEFFAPHSSHGLAFRKDGFYQEDERLRIQSYRFGQDAQGQNFMVLKFAPRERNARPAPPINAPAYQFLIETRAFTPKIQ